MPRFKDLQDALNAGFRKVNRRRDRDTSGYGYFGYSYENAEGEKTEDVWFDEERTNSGFPTFRPMYPPKE